jgi:hypothetical protein
MTSTSYAGAMPLCMYAFPAAACPRRRLFAPRMSAPRSRRAAAW